MSPLIVNLFANFLPAFLSGMVINFEIAGVALVFGLGLGVLLALVHLRGGVTGMAASAVTALMRAAPTFVVMFFLLNAVPHGGMSGMMIVAISLVPYAAAYVADSGVDAIRQFRAGSLLACFLILPNIARAFFVLVMSSSAGAAVGVTEGIAIILHQAEKLPTIGDKLLLFAIGVACFGIPLQLGFAAVRVVQRQLGRATLRLPAERLPGQTTAAAQR
jgi:hypothetical protein